jgi:hypothetical protein
MEHEKSLANYLPIEYVSMCRNNEGDKAGYFKDVCDPWKNIAAWRRF